MTHVIVDDTSTDVDAVREDLRFELIVLHTEVKKLDAGWDFTAVVKPLLDDQGSAILGIPRIKKQIERLKKLRDHVHATAASPPRQRRRPTAGRLRPTVPSRAGGGGGAAAAAAGHAVAAAASPPRLYRRPTT